MRFREDPPILYPYSPDNVPGGFCISKEGIRRHSHEQYDSWVRGDARRAAPPSTLVDNVQQNHPQTVVTADDGWAMTRHPDSVNEYNYVTTKRGE